MGLGIPSNHARWIGGGLLLAGLVVSAADILTAYNQDVSSGGGFGHTLRVAVGEAGGWVGALAGGEVGAEIGTAVLPGIGTIIGGIGGAIVGGILGQQGAEWLDSLSLAQHVRPSRTFMTLRALGRFATGPFEPDLKTEES